MRNQEVPGLDKVAFCSGFEAKKALAAVPLWRGHRAREHIVVSLLLASHNHSLIGCVLEKPPTLSELYVNSECSGRMQNLSGARR